MIGSWYVEPAPAFCENVQPVEASMTQLLVGRHVDDVTAALRDADSDPAGRLTVDVFCPTPSDGSVAGSAGCGSCATPESLDPEMMSCPEVTSSSGSAGNLDDEAEQLFHFASWLP